MVAEIQGVAQVSQQQQLANTVEDVRPGRQARVARALGEDMLAEAVEVADRDPRPDRRAHGFVQPLLELPGGLDVVGQDQDLLRDQRAAERIAVAGRGLRRQVAAGVPLRLQQPAHPLHDDARLPRPGPRDDDDGAVVRLDDRALLRSQVQAIPCNRHRRIQSPQPLDWNPVSPLLIVTMVRRDERSLAMIDESWPRKSRSRAQ